jgi:hypothetical protein
MTPAGNVGSEGGVHGNERDIEILMLVTKDFDYNYFYSNDPTLSAWRRLKAIGLTDDQLIRLIGGGRISNSNIGAFLAPGVCELFDTVLAKHRAGALSLTGICGAIFGTDSMQHHRGHTLTEVGITVTAIGPGFKTLKQEHFRSITLERIKPAAVVCAKAMWAELELVARQVTLETTGDCDFWVRHFSPNRDSGWTRIATRT